MHQHERLRGLEGSWEWLKFAAQLPGQPLTLQPFTGTVVAFQGRCIYLGCNIINNSTTAGRVTVYDGLDASGTIVDVAALPASGVANPGTTAAGVLCESGVSIGVGGLAVAGSVIVVPLWHYEFTPPGE